MSILNKIKNIFKDKQSIKGTNIVNSYEDKNNNKEMNIIIEEYLKKINNGSLDTTNSKGNNKSKYNNKSKDDFKVITVDGIVGNYINSKERHKESYLPGYVSDDLKRTDDNKIVYSIEDLYLDGSFEYNLENNYTNSNDYQRKEPGMFKLYNINTFEMYKDLYIELERVFRHYNLSKDWYNSVMTRVVSNSVSYNIDYLIKRTKILGDMLVRIYVAEVETQSVYPERIRLLKELEDCLRKEGNMLYGIMVYDEYDRISYEKEVTNVINIMNELTLYKYDFKPWYDTEDIIVIHSGNYTLEDSYSYYLNSKVITTV